MLILQGFSLRGPVAESAILHPATSEKTPADTDAAFSDVNMLADG